MIEQLSREWEIAEVYINTVASQKGLINLDWNDFAAMALNHPPVLLLNISEESSLAQIIGKGLEILSNNRSICIEGVILAIEMPNVGEIMMSELQEFSASLLDGFNDDATIIWGIHENNQLSLSLRSVKFFVFGNRK